MWYRPCKHGTSFPSKWKKHDLSRGEYLLFCGRGWESWAWNSVPPWRLRGYSLTIKACDKKMSQSNSGRSLGDKARLCLVLFEWVWKHRGSRYSILILFHAKHVLNTHQWGTWPNWGSASLLLMLTTLCKALLDSWLKKNPYRTKGSWLLWGVSHRKGGANAAV